MPRFELKISNILGGKKSFVLEGRFVNLSVIQSGDFWIDPHISKIWSVHSFIRLFVGLLARRYVGPSSKRRIFFLLNLVLSPISFVLGIVECSAFIFYLGIEFKNILWWYASILFHSLVSS